MFHGSVTSGVTHFRHRGQHIHYSLHYSLHHTNYSCSTRTDNGIASGLFAQGIGDVSYTYTNDNNEQQTMDLPKCLYVPQCNIRLICPRQIGAESGYPRDGLYAQNEHATLIIAGQETTINYDSSSKLPVLFTTSGIRNYLQFCHPMYSFSAQTKSQHNRKLQLHEMCAHEGFCNLNTWIRKGLFPGINPDLSQEPDPVCLFFCFWKGLPYQSQTPHRTHFHWSY